MAGARKPANDEFEIPDLELKDPLAPKSDAPPAAPLGHGSAYGGTIDEDVLADRHAVPETYAVSVTRARTPAIGVARREPPRAAREPSVHDDDDPFEARPFDGGSVLNVVLVALGFASAAAPLARYVHRASGWRLPALLAPALDGGSAIWSGAAAMLTLALTIALAIMGTYARPRSYGYLFSALGLLVTAISFIVITFSVGPNGVPEVPPDGARLIPFALPAVALGMGLRVLGNAWRACERRRAASRAKGFVIAAFSAAFLFAAVELGFGTLAALR